ncbi:MAG: ABC transporter permease [Oscillospiraceae bacterium]|nr:ABC transporter permease [Oscillospiraceae bacterium]
MLSNIFRAKTRSALTISAIAVGVFAVVLISAAGNAGSNEITRTLETMGINSILVQHESASAPPALDPDDIAAITRISGVEKAMPLMSSINKTRLLDENINCFTWGINANAREIISLEALHGRLISSQDTAGRAMVCVIDEDIAIAGYGRSNVVGKTARILLGGVYHDFEIVGVAKSGISTLQSALSGIIPNFVYVPITTMQMLTGKTGYDKIAVLIDENQAMVSPQGQKGDLQIIDAISNTITQTRGENSGLIVSNLLQQKKGLENILTTITVVLSLIAGISLLVSGLTVMTTMLVSVNERKREIGIKKSIGAKDFDIAREFLLESMTLSGIGSTLGAGLGVGVTAIGCAVIGIDFSLNLTPIIMAVSFAVGLGGIFGAYPAVKAAKLEPIEALRQT